MRPIEEFESCKRIIWTETASDGARGIIYMPLWEGTIIVSSGCGWEHVSVSPKKLRITPSWSDMCIIKDIFWREDEAVIQVHPPKEEYINNQPNCLHLWRCTYKDMVLPPAILVGTKKGMTRAEYNKAVKEAYELAGEGK